VITGPEGNILGAAPVFEEAVLLGDIDLARIPPVRYDNPLLADMEAGLPLLMSDLERVMAGSKVLEKIPRPVRGKALVRG